MDKKTNKQKRQKERQEKKTERNIYKWTGRHTHTTESFCRTLKCEAFWFQLNYPPVPSRESKLFFFNNFHFRTTKMVQMAEILAAFNLIPRTKAKMAEEKFDTTNFSSGFHITVWCACVHIHTHTRMVHNNIYIFTLLFYSYLVKIIAP